MLEVEAILGGRASDHVVLVVGVSSQRSELLRVLQSPLVSQWHGEEEGGTYGELDVDAILLHDPLDVLPPTPMILL